MKILAIETSCDDTCVAIVEIRGRKRPRFKILSNIVSSQTEIHKKYGGVYPSLAKREHEKNLPPALTEALYKAKLLISNFQFPISKPNIDVIAVTVGPGLDPCLWAGINFAQELAKNWGLPIVPVNHIESHILVNFIDQIQNSKFKIKNFPAIALIVSGGHTQLILVKNPPTGGGKYKIIGETRDDAAGECFDKVARILGLGYPGGPSIAKGASFPLRSDLDGIRRGRTSIKLPRPMISQKNYDFSFSGLKTAVLYDYKKQNQKTRKSKRYIQEMCKEVQQAVIDVLIKKTIRSAKEYNVKTIILGGGVSANEELRKQFKSQWKGNFLIPEKKFSTDNAAMTAIAGYYNYLRGKTKKTEKIKADANLRIC